jgi:acyl-CoA dehydrogenase
VDFEHSTRSLELQERLRRLVAERVIPSEGEYERQLAELASPHGQPQVMEELKREARSQGLWNLCLPHAPWGAGLGAIDFAPLIELGGRSLIGLEAMNSSAPDSGNMEMLAIFGSPEQQERWLTPLAEGTIRSAFVMSEPDVPSSDPTCLRVAAVPDGDGYAIDGRKWYASGASDDRCEILLVVVRTNDGDDPYGRHSILLVPRETPGVTIGVDHGFFGYRDKFGHPEVTFENVRVSRESLLGVQGQGFVHAQARLGPGRIHYGMRVVGMAERALELLCLRARERAPFGSALADRSVIQDWIGRGRAGIEQARLLVLYAAWQLERGGSRAAREAIAMVKFAALESAFEVIDHAVQVHGAAGVSDRFPLARMYALSRALRIADGPDEVHVRTVARAELRRHLTDATVSR